MKIECECGESITIYKSKEPTQIVDWIDWICDHLFSHASIYFRDGEPFQLSFRASEPAPVRVFDAETGEEITEMFEEEEK